MALLFFLITAGAVVIVYAYVVPQLRSSLIAQKHKTLESVSSVYSRSLRTAMERDSLSSDQLDRLVRRLAQRAGARLTLLGVSQQDGRLRAELYVISDSENLGAAVAGNYLGSARAVQAGHRRRSTGAIGGKNFAQVAQPLRLASQGTPWVAVFSSGLSDVSESVASIQQQILVAGLIALLLALVVGYLVARAIALRAKQLEQAAQMVAAGQFTTPIPVDSDDELGKLARSFNDMQNRLRRLDSARKEFIANASHELRTPLFSLAGSVELLQEEDELDPADRAQFLQTIKEQVDRLTRLATNLLDLSMIDADTLVLQNEHVDLVELANSVADEFKPLAAQHGSQIAVREQGADSSETTCDSSRLAQILRILLDNALTHTPSGTPIAVAVGHEDEKALLAVSDTGPGLTAEQQDQIFDRFFSGSTGKGTGLGLAIAQELAERMGGSLSVTSQPGDTVFLLTLPSSETTG